MPFYRTSELKMEDIGTGNPGEYQPILGDLMKAGVVTYYRGTGTKPHWHNVDEQFFYVTEGKCLFLLGEEAKLNEEGDIVYTSGIDGIIPEAIPIGKIFEEDGSLYVEFFVDFNQLQFVKIYK